MSHSLANTALLNISNLVGLERPSTYPVVPFPDKYQDQINKPLITSELLQAPHAIVFVLFVFLLNPPGQGGWRVFVLR